MSSNESEAAPKCSDEFSRPAGCCQAHFMTTQTLAEGTSVRLRSCRSSLPIIEPWRESTAREAGVGWHLSAPSALRSSRVLCRRRMLGHAEQVSFGIGHRCPLDMRDLVQNVPAVCGAEPDDAFYLLLA